MASPASSQQPLPPNYKTVLDNADVLVQRVHYGPHEFIPPHDHYAVVTVLVYLNDSGVVELAHEPKPGDTEPDVVKRPPTHTGAFRIGPAAFERHSVRNLGDVPSDFFRVELKQLPLDWLKDQVRGPAPTPPLHDGVSTEYTDARLRIDRIICKAATACSIDADPAPSVLITIPTPDELAKEPHLERWVQPGEHVVITTSRDHAQYLRILLLPAKP
ncbi:hypothetical protein [Bryocella elongata]|nr:hypothetical protein [Bryocella elongata]